jgi:hypothetical protein
MLMNLVWFHSIPLPRLRTKTLRACRKLANHDQCLGLRAASEARRRFVHEIPDPKSPSPSSILVFVAPRLAPCPRAPTPKFSSFFILPSDFFILILPSSLECGGAMVAPIFRGQKRGLFKKKT